MSNDVSNADIYGVLLGIKEDIGGLKTSTNLQLEEIKSHNGRIATLEGASQRQKGAVRVWGLVATAAATIAGIAAELIRPHHG